MMAKTISNIHVYHVGDFFYVVPLLRQPNGTWVEVQPALNCKKEVNALRDRIQQISDLRAGGLDLSQTWNGNDGFVWSNATQFWSVYWREDLSISIVPNYLRPTITDPETGDILDGGWANDNRKRVILSDDTSTLRISQTIIDFD